MKIHKDLLQTLFNFFIITFVVIICHSCKNDQPKAYRIIRNKELEKYKHVAVSIHRYEVDLFRCNINNLSEDLKKIKPKYPLFLDADLDDPANIKTMQAFLTDNFIQMMYRETMKQYKDLTFLEVQLTDAFRRAKAALPDFEPPQVYTYVSGGEFEYPVRYTDNMLIIALDSYLGSDFTVYSMYGIPKYVTYRMRKEQIAIDCMKEIARSYVDKYEIKNQSLLDKMIYHGKLLYFLDITFPYVHDSIKIAYTTRQYGWAQKFQGNVWAFFLEHNLLYSKDIMKIQKFITEAPFTSTFSRNSAPRIGQFIGWQIVRQYMLNNPDVQLTQLFYEIDSQKILKLSKYKPKPES